MCPARDEAPPSTELASKIMMPDEMSNGSNDISTAAVYIIVVIVFMMIAVMVVVVI